VSGSLLTTRQDPQNRLTPLSTVIYRYLAIGELTNASPEYRALHTRLSNNMQVMIQLLAHSLGDGKER